MAKKKEKKVKSRKPLPAWAGERLANAAAMAEKGDLLEARDILEAINARCPRRQDVLEPLMAVCADLGDAPRLQRICRELHEMSAAGPETLLTLAQIYMEYARPMLALRTFSEYLELFPTHESAAEVRENYSKLREAAEEILQGIGMSLDDEESATLHEEINVLMAENNIKAARKAALRLVELKPRFVPALNNLGELFWHEGQSSKAIDMAKKALDVAPGNIHALANMVRYSFLSGNETEAHQWAEKLKESDATGFDVWFKKAEALSFLGDDAGVWAVWEAARRDGKEQSPGADAAMAHLAAVAAWRMGREGEAREIWDKWRHNPVNLLQEVMQENLLDLEKPAGERNGPWAFPFRQWVSESVIQDLFHAFQKAERRHVSSQVKERVLQNTTMKCLQAHPELESLAVPVLERGDHMGRQFVIFLAAKARTPRLLEALRDFALSQNGPDALRQESAYGALDAGVLETDENGNLRLWIKEEWRDILHMSFTLEHESPHDFSRAVKKLVIESHQFLRDGDGEKAEELIRRALEECPDDPSLLNNLGVACEMQGKTSESEQILEGIFAKNPDYLFIRVLKARKAIRNGDLEEAGEMLRPLMKRRRLDYGELDAWSHAQVELLIAKKEYAAAKSWLDMWEQVIPESPDIPLMRRLLRNASGG